MSAGNSHGDLKVYVFHTVLGCLADILLALTHKTPSMVVVEISPLRDKIDKSKGISDEVEQLAAGRSETAAGNPCAE